MRIIDIHVDGASKNNHTTLIDSKAYTCVVIPNENYENIQYKQKLTSAEAEWEALIEGLKITKEKEIFRAKIYSDSQLVVKQYNGKYRCKNERMKKYYNIARTLGRELNIEVIWIPREKNLAGLLLDKVFK